LSKQIVQEEEALEAVRMISNKIQEGKIVFILMDLMMIKLQEERSPKSQEE
jgi:hypothetical protein